ncbi:LEA type 2 family protein [Ferruginibacter lapsinanis]|uniref:LEA type 2 family protein n=1 Tax=Ferruginibacter lapsinanis TaxID=563172 RepID=UPI001E36BA6A|nr:LEA type 2 family protein [Ferruginibacter lapsinanis]UEG49591.1 LEA type 2 family protein [Ferruginibacter lapsinanis]
MLISCSTPKSLEYRDFKNFSIEKVGLGSSAIKMDLVYYNPNRFGLQLMRTDLDVYVDSTYLGHTTQEYQITLPRQREFTIPIKMDIDMRNIFKNLLNTAFSKEINLKISGSVKVGKMNVFKTFPIDYTGKQQLSLFQ